MGGHAVTFACGGRSHVLGWSTIFQGGQYFYTMDIVRRYWRRGSLDVPAPFFVHAHDSPGAAFSDSGEDCASSTYFSSAALDRCSLLPNPTPKKLTVDVLKGAIKAIKASSTFQYAGLRVGGNRASLLDQIEAVLEPYEAQDLSFVYKA